MTYRQRFNGRVSAPLDLRDFPFDTQVLPITVLSITYSPDAVAFVFDEAATTTGQSVAPAGWVIEAMGGRVGVLAVERTGVQNRLVRFDYEFQVRRHTRYHIRTEIVPLILIVCMSWAVFWIDPSQLAASAAPNYPPPADIWHPTPLRARGATRGRGTPGRIK